MPRRVTYRRGKVKPPGVVIVTRPSRWGNPHRVEDVGREEAVRRHREDLIAGRLATRAGRIITVADVRRELRGKDLGCSCEPGELCHGDTLIEIANSDDTPPGRP